MSTAPHGTTTPAPAASPVRDLPVPPPLKRMAGPGVIMVGVGMAAGEIILWPYITATEGIGLLWLALMTLVMQYVINMEIERYTLATGETAIGGFSRAWRPWGLVICLAALFQYVWPGWASGGSEVLTFLVGGGDVALITVGSLVVIGVLLSFSPIVYKAVVRVESIKVAATVFFLLVAILTVVSLGDWANAGAEVVRNTGQIPQGVSVALVVGAVGAAGSGGVANLVLSNWVRDKGYGMGAHVPRLVSPITGQEEPSTGGNAFSFPVDEANLARWRTWWRRANAEHLLSFMVVSFVSITVMSLVAFATLQGQDLGEADSGFLETEADVLSATVGPWLRTFFLAFATVSLYASALGLLDVVGRVVSDVLKTNYLADSSFWSESRLYLAAVWAEVAVGSGILLSGLDQPLALLVIATATGAVIMFVYSVLLVRLNRTALPAPIRLRGRRLAAMVVACAFYGVFTVLLVRDQVGQLL
ncbi:MAG: Nramp family divalent metal transporter [Actinomycetes bacterium]